MACRGPCLAAVIALLALRRCVSRAGIRDLLREVVDLMLSVGVIDETIRDAGRTSFPLEDAVADGIVQVAQRHVDETSWSESGALLGLWTLVSTTQHLDGAVPHLPTNTREMLENARQDDYIDILSVCVASWPSLRKNGCAVGGA